MRLRIQSPDRIEHTTRKDQRDDCHHASRQPKRVKRREQHHPDRSASRRRWLFLHLASPVASLPTIFPIRNPHSLAFPFRENVFVCKVRIGESFPGVRRQAIISLIIGATLGCVAGAMIETRQTAVSSAKPYVLSVNQRTGKPQLHVTGQPELE